MIMEFIRRIESPVTYDISKSVRLRPGAKAGSWCGLILPVAMIFSCRKYNQEKILSTYSIATVCAEVSTVYLYMNLFKKKPITTHLVALAVAIISCLLIGLDFENAVRVTSFLILINMKSYSLLYKLLDQFPYCFSIGEAILVIEGSVVFTYATISNCVLDGASITTVFCQIFLIAIGTFLLGTNLTNHFQKLLPFILLFFSMMGSVTLPTMVWVLKRNPITWFLFDFVFLKTTRIMLIGYWLACTILALIIAWRFGSTGSSVKLTVLRKYFHGVVVAIYLPGIFFDVELLFAASVIVFAAFLLLESARLYNLEHLGNILSTNMVGFLDEKDQGTLILTHIYLLVGCSLPIWIFPLNAATDARDNLLLCSGIVSLGIGDTAASIGGTLWGRTKFPGSSKSVEGTLCSMLAEICFMLILFYFGMFGGSSRLPWLAFILSAVVTSLVEAFTTQVDNLVLPLVMYILLLVL